MKITSLHLQNFKRFTDLRIEQIPESTKMVLLIGSNGSGKSSLFDAFDWLNKGPNKGVPYSGELANNYYRKVRSEEVRGEFRLGDSSTISKVDWSLSPHSDAVKRFIGRSSNRNVPRIGNNANPDAIVTDQDSPLTFIENDQRFVNDVFQYIQSINKALREPVFRGEKADTLQIFKEFIDPFNKSLSNIFGGNSRTTIRISEFEDASPNSPAKLIFEKGGSKINYDLLSHGEKQVVILLLNFIVRQTYYEDTILFIDEMDVHLNTRLQFNLLKEITEVWIPESAQLWTASHALGFIDYARQTENAVILDFDDLDFDQTHVLVPVPKDNPDVYEIAVGKEYLPQLFQGMALWFVENRDRDYYASIGLPKTIFISDNNRNAVYLKARSTNFNGLVDRDFLTDNDISEIETYYPRLRILRYYSLENYLYHPDNLEEYHNRRGTPFDKQGYEEALCKTKNEISGQLLTGIALDRTSYPYFSEPEFNGKPLQNRFKNKQENKDKSVELAKMLKSDVLEEYYKVLPMKTYCTQLPERQNIAKSDLAKTMWFKNSIQKLLFM